MEQIILNIENPDIVDDVMERLKDFVKSIKGVSITKSKAKITYKSEKEKMLDIVCGSWAGHGRTSDDDIKDIYSSRQQNVTRIIEEL